MNFQKDLIVNLNSIPSYESESPPAWLRFAARMRSLEPPGAPRDPGLFWRDCRNSGATCPPLSGGPGTEGTTWTLCPDSEFFPPLVSPRIGRIPLFLAGVLHLRGRVWFETHLVNPGSASRMFDADPRTIFATLTPISRKIEVENFRIPYPVEAVVDGLKKIRLPSVYAKMYRKGKKTE